MGRTERQSGVALLMALGCIMVMALFATMMFEPIRAETVMAGAAKDDMTVLYAAEAGIEMAVADLLRAERKPGSREFAVGRATARYTIAKDSTAPGRFHVTAVGLLPGRRGRTIRKTITAEMALHADKSGGRVEVLWHHVRR